MGSGRRSDRSLRIRGKEKKTGCIHRQFTDWYSEEGHRRLYDYTCAENEEIIMVGM
jgi:hypothetical protein